MSQPGADLIRIERMRQVVSEGYTAEHDTGHTNDLISAARAYADAAEGAFYLASYGNPPDDILRQLTPVPPTWPWAPEFWKPTADWRRMAVKAGALLAAALDSDPHEPAAEQYTVVGRWAEVHPEGVGPVATFVYAGVVTPVHGPEEAAGWYEVVTAANGTEAVQVALAKAAERRSAEETPGGAA